MSFNLENLSEEEKKILKELAAQELSKREVKEPIRIIQPNKRKSRLTPTKIAEEIEDRPHRRKQPIATKESKHGKVAARREAVQIGRRTKLIGSDPEAPKDNPKLKSKLYPNKPIPRSRHYDLVEAFCTGCEFYVDIDPKLTYQDKELGLVCRCEDCQNK